jgi:hypothetical protein
MEISYTAVLFCGALKPRSSEARELCKGQHEPLPVLRGFPVMAITECSIALGQNWDDGAHTVRGILPAWMSPKEILICVKALALKAYKAK